MEVDPLGLVIKIKLKGFFIFRGGSKYKDTKVESRRGALNNELVHLR